MELILHTKVAGNYEDVLQRFDRDLFLALAPDFPKFRLLRFDGSTTGDVVAIELKFGPIRQQWTSLITERQITEVEAWFTDEGQILPPPLKKWKHRHLVTRLTDNTSRITDHITFSTGSLLLDWLAYPLFYAQFASRRPKYKRYFGAAS